MTIPGEVTLDEMKKLLDRAHKGEIIDLYIFVLGNGHEYWSRYLDKDSRFDGEALWYSSRRAASNGQYRRHVDCFNETWIDERIVLIFKNYWFACAFSLKEYGRAATPITVD